MESPQTGSHRHGKVVADRLHQQTTQSLETVNALIDIIGGGHVVDTAVQPPVDPDLTPENAEGAKGVRGDRKFGRFIPDAS